MADTLNLSSGLVKLPQQVAALSAQAICCLAGCCHLQQVAGVAAQASCCSASCCLLQQVAGLAAQGNCCQAASCWPSCSSKLLSGCKLLAQLLKQAAVRMQVASCWFLAAPSKLLSCRLLSPLPSKLLFCPYGEYSRDLLVYWSWIWTAHHWLGNWPRFVQRAAKCSPLPQPVFCLNWPNSGQSALAQ